MDGLAATRELLGPGSVTTHRPRVLVLTTFDLDDYVYEALRAGASGFLLKDATAAELVTAVRVVADGEALLAPTVTRRLIERFARHEPADPIDATALRDLTPREVEVLRLIARGHTNREMAERLYLSVRTVESHRARIQRKLGRSSRSDLVEYVTERGLIEPAEVPG
jgi:DNA-binding NarL/FixJ family response regulator